MSIDDRESEKISIYRQLQRGFIFFSAAIAIVLSAESGLTSEKTVS